MNTPAKRERRTLAPHGEAPAPAAELAAAGAQLDDLGAAGIARWMVYARQVGEARSLPMIGQVAARAALEVSGARSARVLIAGAGGELETVAVANRPGVSSLLGTGLPFDTVRPGGPGSEALASRLPRSDGERVWLPLTARDRAVGLVELLGCGEAAARRLDAYLSPAGLALEGARLNAERGRREREARALADLSREIGGTLDLAQILQRTVEFAVRSLGLERGILALYDEVRESTAISNDLFSVGFGNDLVAEPGLTLSRESFERLVVKNQPIVLNDVRSSSRSYAAGPRALGAESMLMVPMAARGRPLGMMYLDSTRAGIEIRDRAVALGQAIAEQASLAVENARLYAAEHKKRASAEALREVALTLGSTLDLGEILERILRHARDLVGASACAVLELGTDGWLTVRTGLGLDAEFMRENRMPVGVGATGLAVQQGRPVPIYDLNAMAGQPDAPPFPEYVTHAQAEGRYPFAAVIGLPLAARGRVFGGLALYFEEPQDFPEDDVQLLEVFAGHAAVALENARLYEDEVRREREAGVLLRVARFTGETLQLQEVLTRVAAEVADALDLERCFLGFLESAGERRAELGRLYAYGFDTDLEDLRPFVIADEAFDRLLVDRAAIVFNDLPGDDTLSGQGPSLLSAQACVIAPLIAQGQVLGILYADTARPGAIIADRDVDLAAAIADQAALAIQNARLYEALLAQESRYRLLAEAAHDMIFTTDLEGCITYANPAVGRTLGYEPFDLLGRPFQGILEPSTLAPAERAWSQLIFADSPTGARSYEGLVRREDGSLAYVEVNLNVLRLDGEIVGTLSIARDLSEKRQLAEEIAQRGLALEREEARALELRAYLSLFTQAQEEERRRIARELHDDTAQTLVAIARRLDRLEASVPEDARERVADLRGDLDLAIDSVRRFSRNLRPSVLDDLGLLPALEWLAGQAQTETRLEVAGLERRLSSDLELCVFRVVQEALTNVDKHARAAHATVHVRYGPAGSLFGERPDEDSITVVVADDGRGFGAAALGDVTPAEGPRGAAGLAFAALASNGRLGLAGTRERVALSGGELRIETEPGRGSRLTFWFPAA